MGIDHSNPYIHGTTVLCDIYMEAEPTHKNRHHISLSLMEYKVLVAIQIVNTFLYVQPVHSAPSCYVLVAKHLCNVRQM